ncbi:BnaA03g60740D [Brassica napus]|uniref:BnaA03g60740D protein n=1 Tax=Brassica napus TaxID=3708 RepID=A0A078ICM1_BRANA|nr:BnaA03g60740D [Brassica napus]
MVRLIRVMKGQWSKSQQGVWRFTQDQSVLRQYILIRDNEQFDRVRGFVRGVFNLTPGTPLLITFQLPTWMLEPNGETCPTHNIATTADVEMLTSVHKWNTEQTLYVIFGAEDVAQYQFTCRAPFKIRSWSFLGKGVTEESHMNAIMGSPDNPLGHPILFLSEDSSSASSGRNKPQLECEGTMSKGNVGTQDRLTGRIFFPVPDDAADDAINPVKVKEATGDMGKSC